MDASGSYFLSVYEGFVAVVIVGFLLLDFGSCLFTDTVIALSCLEGTALCWPWNV